MMNYALVQLTRHLYRPHNAFVTLNSMHIVSSGATNTNAWLICFFLLLYAFSGFSRSKGIFFVNTNKEPPYAKGILPEFTLSDNGTETTTVGDAES